MFRPECAEVCSFQSSTWILDRAIRHPVVGSPTTAHHKATIRVLRYLKNAPVNGLFFHVNTDFTFTDFTDDDWATCPDSRRSVLGYCFFLGTSLISWKSSKKQTVSQSSSEAKYRALANATCEGLWRLRLLQVLGVDHDWLFTLYSDSQFTLHMAANPVLHEQIKHIETYCVR
ncbi:uncharacterized mitochondrial protein AtMg00810-like [Arachis duranensis]|uniref:Uncharacterized mitochondrial protein AtMg00810-like n=1 Tax=Arachis duranensis TaxID=130453 RepID=A0A6P4CG15_ARADU|nr:uncharacterized mitochondrial protein AtMg00810-like [Arachis duranensis]